MTKHEETAKRLDLPNGYWLEKESDNGWWIGRGRLNLALKIVPSVPCGVGGSIDSEVEKIAAALAQVEAEKDEIIEKLNDGLRVLGKQTDAETARLKAENLRLSHEGLLVEKQAAEAERDYF